VQVLDLEQARLGGAVVAGLGALLLVAAGAECALAGAREADDTDLRSAQALLKQWISSSTVRARKAFIRSGRSIVMVASPSSTS
jgi:hypothetical protein